MLTSRRGPHHNKRKCTGSLVVRFAVLSVLLVLVQRQVSIITSSSSSSLSGDSHRVSLLLFDYYNGNNGSNHNGTSSSHLSSFLDDSVQGEFDKARIHHQEQDQGKDRREFRYSAMSFPTHPIKARPALDGRSDPQTAGSIVTADSARERQNQLASLGDPIHLGGFAMGLDDGTYSVGSKGLRNDIPNDGFSPSVFEHMIRAWGIRSLLDVGCGRGWTTSWFLYHGVRAQCVEGSSAAYRQSVLPVTTSTRRRGSNNRTEASFLANEHDGGGDVPHLTQHDFTRGPWWPDRTVDVAWAQGFVQQVSMQYAQNYLAAFAKSAIVVVTTPQEPGWHHVEIHEHQWWIDKFERNGFKYDDKLTEQVKRVAFEDFVRKKVVPYDPTSSVLSDRDNAGGDDRGPKRYRPEALWKNALVRTTTNRILPTKTHSSRKILDGILLTYPILYTFSGLTLALSPTFSPPSRFSSIIASLAYPSTSTYSQKSAATRAPMATVNWYIANARLRLANYSKRPCPPTFTRST